MASVQRGGGVGRVGDERVNGMGHLVTEHRELIHSKSGLVLSVDGLVANETSSLRIVRFLFLRHDDPNSLR